MRTYLSTRNLMSASLLGGAITLLAIPRIIDGGLPPHLFIPASLFSMTLISGMATAWGKKAGMCGIFPDMKRTIRGMGVALLAVLVLIPVCVFWFDSVLYEAAQTSGDAEFIRMLFPRTAFGMLALMLWATGFETMFFEAAAMSYFSRLTGKQWVAVLMSILLRCTVTYLRLSAVGATDQALLFLGSVIVATLIGCTLFAKFGLPAAMLFSAGMAIRSLSL